MPTDTSFAPQQGNIVDLVSLSTNFPALPQREVIRDNTTNTLLRILDDNAYAVSVEGSEGLGKTTTLSQFARRHPQTAFSIFVSAANRLSYDPDLVRADLTGQVFWAVEGSVLDRTLYDPALLKSYYAQLQHKAKQRKQTFYFIVDGIDELSAHAASSFLQVLPDILPIGIPQFRFLFAGDESLYKQLLGNRLSLKSFPLTEFSLEEAGSLLQGFDIDIQVLNEIKSLCRGLPGRLSSARRALEKGASSSDFIKDAPRKWPEFFEIDWKQVPPEDHELHRILALLAHDPKPHTIADIAATLSISEDEVGRSIALVSFLVLEPSSGNVSFVSSGLRNYAAERLQNRKRSVQQLLIKRLLAAPASDQAIMDLPGYMEDAAEYSDLLSLLTPDHIVAVLERTQTLSRVDETVKRGLRSARKLSRDPDILRFSFQQSIISDLASANVWESEVAALAALKRDTEAMVLANNAILREDRLQLLTALSHHIWLRGDAVPPELIDQIRLLIQHVDFGSLGKRADKIASQLTCVNADLASTVLTRAKHNLDEDSLDHAFARSTVSALRGVKDDQKRNQIIDSVVRSRKHSSTGGLLAGVRVLSGKLSPAEVRDSVKEISKPMARISVLRYWCLLNGSESGANEVATYALTLAVGEKAFTLDADFLADVSQALLGVENERDCRELIGMLDGLRATAERLGPSVDVVRLQLTIAVAEMMFARRSAEARFMELSNYVGSIIDLPSKGQAYAQFLGTLRSQHRRNPSEIRAQLEKQCARELEDVVLRLSESTADHHLALGGIISGLAVGDLEKALDYTQVANTERRRDAILGDAVTTLLRRSLSTIDPRALKKVVDSIRGPYERDEALADIFSRLSDEGSLTASQLKELVPLISLLPSMAASMDSCRSMVAALKVLSADCTATWESLRTHIRDALYKRWCLMDVGWERVDSGYGIAGDLVSFNRSEAERYVAETDALRKEWRIAVQAGASTYVASLRILIRIYSGLLPRNLDTQVDLEALEALIDILPSFGERAVLWADLSMRAQLAKRSDLANKIVNDHLYPDYTRVHREDCVHKSSVFIRIAPALYRAQPASFLAELESFESDDQDSALFQAAGFLLRSRVPTDPVENSMRASKEISYEILLQLEQLMSRITTDWMLYSLTADIAESLTAGINRHSLTVPQREDIARRLTDLANSKLPSLRHITHPGYRIVTLAQAQRIKQGKANDWHVLLKEAKRLDNVSDRTYVTQVLATCLPKHMAAERERIIQNAIQEIDAIPWHFDQAERLLGMAEELHGKNNALCRDLIKRTASVIERSEDDVREQRRQLVDIAYRVDEEFAKGLIETFDDDVVKKRALGQVRLLDARRTITDTEGTTNHEEVLRRFRGADVHKLGTLLLRSLNSGRIQHFHPNQVREYMDLAANQPLRIAYPMLSWYAENAVVRYSQTEQAAAFIRPMYEACVVATQLAGQISGRSLIRLKALKHQSNELSSERSILVTPDSREEAVRILTTWLERNIGEEVKIHDPYFGPQDLHWLQLFRTANSKCTITIMTSREHQPTGADAETLEDIYQDAWRGMYDQAPPKAEIAVIGGEKSKASPIHDRWLVSNDSGLRFGTSFNSLGITKDSEISEMSASDVSQKRHEIEAYLSREKAEFRGEKLRLFRFWL